MVGVSLRNEGGLRRCEGLGLRLVDVQVPDRSLFIAEGKGGRQRVIPISNRFFVAVGDYLRHERPRGIDTDRVFVALKGWTRGLLLAADGIDTILRRARDWAELTNATCHQLRHTCLTRLREAARKSKRSKPRPGMSRSSRPASTFTSQTIGSSPRGPGRLRCGATW
jgi:integrase